MITKGEKSWDASVTQGNVYCINIVEMHEGEVELVQSTLSLTQSIVVKGSMQRNCLAPFFVELI